MRAIYSIDENYFDVGAFHGNLPHVANVDNQHNSINLQVSVAMELLLHSSGHCH
jgi:hypothetical protein